MYFVYLQTLWRISLRTFVDPLPNLNYYANVYRLILQCKYHLSFLLFLQVTIDHHPIRFFVHKRPHVDFFLECVSIWNSVLHLPPVIPLITLLDHLKCLKIQPVKWLHCGLVPLLLGIGENTAQMCMWYDNIIYNFPGHCLGWH